MLKQFKIKQILGKNIIIILYINIIYKYYRQNQSFKTIRDIVSSL